MTEETVSTRTEWNNGELDKTSADRDNESGVLGIGYVNGDFGGTTTQIISDMLRFYRLDGNANDFSGNDQNGTVQGNLSTVNGVFSTDAFEFPGTGTDFVETDSWGSFGSDIADPGPGATLSFWVKPNNLGDTEYFVGITDRDDNDDIQNFWRIGTNVDGTNEVALNMRTEPSGSTTSIYTSDNVLSNNEWTHIAIVWRTHSGSPSTSDYEIYINGVDETLAIDDGGNADGEDWTDFQNPVGIGGFQDGNEVNIPFEGVIDEFKVFQDTLSQNEIENLYFDGHLNNDFTGEWSQTFFDNGIEEGFDEFDPTGISAPTGTQGDLIFESLDDQDNVNDTLTITDKTDDTPVDLSGLAPGHKLQVTIEITVNQ